MAANPATLKVRAAVLASATTLVTRGGDHDVVYALNFCNTTTADITLDVYELDADGSTKHYLLKAAVVPLQGVLQWTGACILDAASETVKALASATGVDCNGAYLEYS